MLRHLLVTSAAVLTLTVPLGVPAAQADGVEIGVRIGGPVYRPYRPVTVVTAPPAVVVVPPPPAAVVYSPPPVVVVPEPHRRHFHVQYRRCCADPWIEYGAFRHRDRAFDTERVLARRGYEARVVFE